MALTKVKLIADGTIVQSNLHASHGITTADIGENASYLYYTDARARAAVSVSGNALSYDSSTGVITSNFEESPTFTGNVVIDGTLDTGGRVKVSGGNTDQYYFEGSRNSVGVTYRLYDNANNIYHDSYTSQVFRLNQNGGSGGNLIITGGNVGIGNAVVSAINSASGLGNLVVGDGGASSQGITIYTGTATYGALNFADATSGTGAYQGYIKFDHTDNSFGHYIGNVEKMRIASDGQVTVTGTSTTMKLYNGSSFTGVLHFGNADFLLGFDSGVFKQRIWDGADYFNAIEYNGSSHRLILAPSEGSVGIGTSSSSHKLDVNGDGKFVSNSSSRVLYLKQNAVNAGNIVQFLDQNGSNIWEVVGRNNQFYIYNNALGNFSLYVNPSNNDIGIGNSSPGHKLDVSGKIRSTGGMETTYMDFTGPSSQIGTDTYTNGFYVYDNSAYRMVIKTGTGYVGIGYVNPNQKLDVNGNIGIPGAGKIVINNEPTAWFFQGRTTDSTSFLGTNLKNLLYCGGGAAEGFAIAGTGTGDASFEIKNNGDAKIKTRLGIGTTDYQNSVLHAAGTISLESLGYNTFDALNTGSGGIWSKIGTWYTAQGGRNLSIKLSAGSGYNASLSQNGEVYIELRTSNGSAAAPNISGRYWTLGINEYISNVRVKEINQGEYEIYIQAGAYIGQGQIQAVHSLTDKFDRSISYNTGTPGGTVLSLTKYYYLRSPFYCYYDITTTEDIYIDSGTNYNDIGYLYLSNGRSSVSSEVVSGTAQGDTNLAFTTRYNGNAHTAGTFTHFGYFKAKGRNKTSFTYGSGYTFHNIESHEANEPTLVVHNSINTGEMYGINVIHTLDRNNTTSRFYAGQGAGTERIKIYSNGNIQNSNNSYGQLSDETIKENIVDATPKLDEINQVRVVNFNYIDDVDEETGIPNKQIGVVAQELEQIFPGLVYEAGNTEINENGKEIPTGETTKAVKYSVFVPMLIKAVQELTQEVQTLKDQINGIN